MTGYLKKYAWAALWAFGVYLLSFLAYLPALLQRCGVAVPDAALYLRYGFVLVPALVSLVFLLRERGVAAFMRGNFRRASWEEWGVCGAFALAGAAVTLGYSALSGIDLFAAEYPSALQFAAAGAYLFATALVEETAWRGYLLRRLAAGGGKTRHVLSVGALWGVWHLPMWCIRNSLGLKEVFPLLLWTLLVSWALGSVYMRYRSLFSTTLCHMAFNMCFLAPVWYNILALLAISALCGRVRACRMAHK